MSKKFNFNDAMDMRRIAASRGYGSKEWIEFACFMFDNFPEIYETARKMTVHQDDLWKEILLLRYTNDELCHKISLLSNNQLEE